MTIDSEIEKLKAKYSNDELEKLYKKLDLIIDWSKTNIYWRYGKLFTRIDDKKVEMKNHV